VISSAFMVECSPDVGMDGLVMIVRARSEIRELTDEELETVSGGKTPSPGGPQPIPYPNVLNSRGSWWRGTDEANGQSA
jgi:bacteriocin-like protein